MPDTQELGDRLLAARPADDDAVLQAIVAARLFGPARAAGAKVGRFSLLERIGRGGTSDVFAAHDPVLDRKVALKLLRTDAGVQKLDADERSWLLREARAAARLTHPNVVAVYEVGELDDGSEGIWVAMEHIEGVTLRAWLREERPLEQLLRVFVHAGLGLAAAHDAGVIHRDFKPENVLVSGEGADLRAQVVDFGLARMAERMRGDDEAGSTDGARHSTPMGTPAYMAPEQLKRHPADARSDQFAFCVALHEALAGRHPFGADRPGTTPRELLARIASGPGERAGPRWLRRIAARGMQLEPGDRHPSMHAVVRELQATPARRRRRRIALAGAVLVAGSSGLTLAGLEHVARSSCAEAEAELQGVWDPSVRAAAQAAFAGSVLAGANEVWQRLAPRIDDYAQAWIASREQTCQGRLGGAGLAPELAALRNACLDRRRAELRGLTELLTTPEPTTIRAAIDAANRLTPVTSCDDVESLRRETSLVDGAEDLATVEALRQEIARRTTQAQAGRGPALAATASTLLTRARELATPIPLAEALVLHGLVDDARGDYDAAAASLEAASLEAIAARHDRLHAEVAVRLVWIHGVRRREAALADVWAARAEAAIRACRGDPALTARLLDQRGVMARLAHDPVAAERLHREAAELLRTLGPQAGSELPSSIGNLGLALLAQGRFAEATPLLEESLARFRDMFGPRHPAVASMLGNLGQAHVATGDPARGAAQLREALALKEQLFGPDHVELLRTVDPLAGALDELGEHEEARTLLQRALAIAERAFGPDAPQLELLLHNAAFQAWLAGDHAAVVREASRALALQRRLYGEDHPALALTEELLARGQLGLGDPTAAAATIRHALALAEHGSLTPSERGGVLLSAAWIERANEAPPDRVHALAESARALLGDDPDPNAARELAVLLGP